MGKKGLGAMALFFGIGGFVLPFFGLQFRVLSMLGSAQNIVAIIIAVVGLGLLVSKE